MTTIVERTVLFADLRGSTGLFERLGNAEAAAVVTQSVALMGQIVASCGGVVIKTLGDGLMAVFEEPQGSIDAADGMHESLDRIVDAEPLPGGLRVPALKLGQTAEVASDDEEAGPALEVEGLFTIPLAEAREVFEATLPRHFG